MESDDDYGFHVANDKIKRIQNILSLFRKNPVFQYFVQQAIEYKMILDCLRTIDKVLKGNNVENISNQTYVLIQKNYPTSVINSSLN